MQLAQDLRSGRLVAIKFLHQGPGFDEKVIARELLNHKACAMHPHIVQLQARSRPTAPCLSLTTVTARLPSPVRPCSMARRAGRG